MWVGCLEVKEEENISEGSGHGNERNGYAQLRNLTVPSELKNS